jgi:hypothetical protein
MGIEMFRVKAVPHASSKTLPRPGSR